MESRKMKMDHNNDKYDFRKRAKAFAVQIIHLYSSLPKETAVQVCGKQILRSGTSIAANDREAYRARSSAEFISKLGICLQEADETQFLFHSLKNDRFHLS